MLNTIGFVQHHFAPLFPIDNKQQGTADVMSLPWENVTNTYGSGFKPTVPQEPADNKTNQETNGAAKLKEQQDQKK